MGHVPSRGCTRGNHRLMFHSLPFSLPSPSLKINKQSPLKNRKSNCDWAINWSSLRWSSTITWLDSSEFVKDQLSELISRCLKTYPEFVFNWCGKRFKCGNDCWSKKKSILINPITQALRGSPGSPRVRREAEGGRGTEGGGLSCGFCGKEGVKQGKGAKQV